jgi:hypothetical protein
MLSDRKLNSGSGPGAPACYRDLLTLELTGLETLARVLRHELAVLRAREQSGADSWPAHHPESAEGWYAHMLS